MALINADWVSQQVERALKRPIPLARTAEKALDRSISRVAQASADQVSLSSGARMVATAKGLLDGLTHGEYSHHTFIDPSRGIVQTDCSGLIDYLADRVKPGSLAKLPLDPGFDHPRAWDFKRFFEQQPETAAVDRAWRKVAKPAELRPGDVIAWENVGFKPGENTGHTMLVAGAPTPVQEGALLKGFDVPIIDSTGHGHGLGDTRPPGQTGIGKGTIFLATDAQGATSGFSWKPSAEHDALRPPTMAFGRLN